jgi:hypothetical protein
VRWDDVEPLLRATYRLLEDEIIVGGHAVLASLSEPPSAEDAGRAFRALNEAGYVKAMIGIGEPVPYGLEATERGLQYCSGWPQPGESAVFIDAFLRAINERIENPDTPEDQRGRLRQLAESAGSVGRDLLVDISARVIEHKTGL